MSNRQSNATPSTAWLCLALMSGLLPSWPGSPAYADDLAAGGGAPVQSAAEPAANKLTTLSLEELMAIEVDTVYGASKHEQKVTEAPSAVSIVTADDIKKQGYRTLADVLRSVRGFYVTYDRGSLLSR